MKAAFFILCTENNYREALKDNPEITFHPPWSRHGTHYESIEFEGFYFKVDRIATSLIWKKKSWAPTLRWDLILLLPEFHITDKALKLFRRLNVKRRSPSNYREVDMYRIEGPFDGDDALKELGAELEYTLEDPETGETIVKNRLLNDDGTLALPHIFAGDPQPEVLAKMRYKPTGEECDLDSVSNDSTVWAELPQEK